MRFRVFLLAGLVLLIGSVHARRSFGGFGFGRRGGSSRPKAPTPPRRVTPSTNNQFLNHERGSSSGTIHRPSAPPAPKPPQTSGPIGFERFGSNQGSTNQGNRPIGFGNNQGSTNQGNQHIGFGSNQGSTNQGNQPIGFDRVNSEVLKRPGGSYEPSAPKYPVSSHVPSAPPYQGAPNGPPPAYPGSHFGGNYGGYEHPPAYPGRPINAPPSYSPTNPHYGQTNNYQPGVGNSYPQQGYFGQNFGSPNIGSTYYQPSQFGSVGHGSYPVFGNSYHQGSYYGSSYQGNAYGGTPFGGTGYSGNPYFSPNNFGYSNNPGYFGSQASYSGFPGHYERRSSFSGLPIPIPIPIPIPYGGGGFGGFGGFGYHNYNHRLLDTFIKKASPPPGNSSASVFVLNNSTVTPCTTDHFVYDLLKVTVIACTAENCTAIKMSTITNVSNVVSVHSVGLTMCLGDNVTFSDFGDIVKPTLSKVLQENVTVCRNESTVDSKVNQTAKVENVTTTEIPNTTDITTTAETTTYSTTIEPVVSTTVAPKNVTNSTTVCDQVSCHSIEMCHPSIEIVDQCATKDCPFRRTGHKPCINLKMCRSPNAPVSSFASIDTIVSKIDEFNNHKDVQKIMSNLTLISYHHRVVSLNCTQNVTLPGCPTPLPQTECLPQNSTQTVNSGGTSPPLCTPTLPLSTNSTGT